MGKSGSGQRAPKKLRGSDARAKKMAELARDAAKAAIDGDAARRTLLKVVASLVADRGGAVRVPLRVLAVALDVEVSLVSKGTPEAAYVFRIKLPDVVVGDRVVVHSWSSTLGDEPDHVGVAWPGVVESVDEGRLVVLLDEWVQLELSMPRVVVPRGWVRFATPSDVAESVELEKVEASTRVDG